MFIFNGAIHHNVPLVGDGRAKKRQFFGLSQFLQVQNHFHLSLIPDYRLLAIMVCSDTFENHGGYTILISVTFTLSDFSFK